MSAAQNLFDLVAWDLMHMGHFNEFGAAPLALAEAARDVQVGGVVYDTSIMAIQGAGTVVDFQFHEVLATDRMDADYVPACLPTLDWRVSESPVSGFNNPAEALNVAFPVRIHRRRSNSSAFATATTNVSQARPPLFSNTWSTQSVRLRGGLGDRQGLFLFHQLSNEGATAGNLTCLVRVSGTLYYRLKY